MKGSMKMKSIVLCYNLKGTKKGKQIAMIFGFLGFKIRHVGQEEYLKPVKALLLGEQGEEAPVCEDGFDDEMLIMQSEKEDQLDQALFLMRKEKVTVGLKAMVTPTNQEWTSIALHDEILKEHEYMKEKEKERKKQD